MNGNIYNYACLPPPPPPPPPLPPLQSSARASEHNMEVVHWSYWSTGSSSFVQDFSRPPPSIRGSYRMPRPHRYGSPGSPRHYSPRPWFNEGNQFRTASQQPWQRNARRGGFKRPRPDSECSDSGKLMKRKKKGQLQRVAKKVWTKVDAEVALQMEKDHNKKIKNRSLIIKFPDVEINKDIVSQFHPEIKNVHFQQPSTPRYCFVTLKPTVDPDTVIEALKQQKFGDGYLSVEYKKERDDDQVVLPEDIDPFTLYVGNLAQEVTKEDMVKMYPKSRRIDIGYAMKMKYTRYAFVGFKSMEDCRDAFKRTHSKEIRSKSLIVRFRRIHGTVGMPGESKSQNPPRSERGGAAAQNDRHEIILDEFESSDKADDSSASVPPVTLDAIKEEPKFLEEEAEEENVEVKPNPATRDYVSPFMPGSLDAAFAQIKPMVKQENAPVKTEDINDHQTDDATKVTFKEEPIFLQDSEDDNLYDVGFEECIYRNETDEDDEDDDDDENDEYAPEQVTNFDNLYTSMVNRVNFFNSLKESK